MVYLLFSLFQPQQLWVIAAGIVSEYFGYGFVFVRLILFMMQQIAPGKHQMGHYAFANSLMNLGVMVPGVISGFLSERLGYAHFFILVMIVTVPALIVTRLVPFTHDDRKKEVQQEANRLTCSEKPGILFFTVCNLMKIHKFFKVFCKKT